jgi:hypothetical protein
VFPWHARRPFSGYCGHAEYCKRSARPSIDAVMTSVGTCHKHSYEPAIFTLNLFRKVALGVSGSTEDLQRHQPRDFVDVQRTYRAISLDSVIRFGPP